MFRHAMMVLAVVTAWAGASVRAASIDVSACGQAVPPGATGELQTDLACGAQHGALLEEGATLRLNGHTLSGGTAGVMCAAKRCTVEGPGAITSFSHCAVTTTTNPGYYVIALRDGLEIRDNGCALAAPGTVQVKLRLDEVTISGNLSGIAAHTIKGRSVLVVGNGSGGLSARKKLSLRDSTVTSNGGPGVFSWGGLRLRDTAVTGNDQSGGIDVASNRRPTLKGTTCGRSQQLPEFPALPDPGAAAWGVCAGD